jgi:hypothetical protein
MGPGEGTMRNQGTDGGGKTEERGDAEERNQTAPTIRGGPAGARQGKRPARGRGLGRGMAGVERKFRRGRQPEAGKARMEREEPESGSWAERSRE